MRTQAEVFGAFQGALGQGCDQLLPGGRREKTRRKICRQDFPAPTDEVVLEVIHLDGRGREMVAVRRSPCQRMDSGIERARRSTPWVEIFAAKLDCQTPSVIPIKFWQGYLRIFRIGFEL